jgi:hypothetical protein
VQPYVSAPLREQVEREMAGLTSKTPAQVALEDAKAAAKVGLYTSRMRIPCQRLTK